MKTQFEQDLQSDLRNCEQGIDAEHITRLANIRQQALSAAPVSSVSAPRRLRRFLWPTASMTLASLLVLVLVSPLSPFTSVPMNEQVSDNFELYDDLEFYYWLADNEQDLRG